MATSIWFKKELQPADLHPLLPGTMAAFLNMQWVEVGADYLKMRMPVDERTKQPSGLLHGGASCALAETIGSIGAYLVIDRDKFHCVGMEINANHVKAVRDGYVTATARPLHIGSATQVWDIRIHDLEERLICVSRLTVAILKK